MLNGTPRTTAQGNNFTAQHKGWNQSFSPIWIHTRKAQTGRATGRVAPLPSPAGSSSWLAQEHAWARGLAAPSQGPALTQPTEPRKGSKTACTHSRCEHGSQQMSPSPSAAAWVTQVEKPPSTGTLPWALYLLRGRGCGWERRPFSRCSGCPTSGGLEQMVTRSASPLLARTFSLPSAWRLAICCSLLEAAGSSVVGGLRLTTFIFIYICVSRRVAICQIWKRLIGSDGQIN